MSSSLDHNRKTAGVLALLGGFTASMSKSSCFNSSCWWHFSPETWPSGMAMQVLASGPSDFHSSMVKKMLELVHKRCQGLSLIITTFRNIHVYLDVPIVTFGCWCCGFQWHPRSVLLAQTAICSTQHLKALAWPTNFILQSVDHFSGPLFFWNRSLLVGLAQFCIG